MGKLKLNFVMKYCDVSIHFYEIVEVTFYLVIKAEGNGRRKFHHFSKDILVSTFIVYYDIISKLPNSDPVMHSSDVFMNILPLYEDECCYVLALQYVGRNQQEEFVSQKRFVDS